MYSHDCLLVVPCFIQPTADETTTKPRMMSTPTAASPLSAADRARKKAEARRSRILAKSADRLDVVNGLTPGASIREKKHDAPPGAPVDDNDIDADDASTPREIVVDLLSSAVVVSPVVASAAAMAECGEAEAEAEAASSSPESPSAAVAVAEAEAEAEARGARRMAAMRRRRYQSKGVGRPVEEDGASGGGDGAGGGETAAASLEPALMADADAPTTAPPVSKVEEEVEEEGSRPSAANDGPDNASAPTMADERTKEEEEAEEFEQKKYMGVARMRRMRLKEQKERRLQEIANDGRTASAAEMATMGVTASMVRRGLVVEVDGASASASAGGGARKGWLGLVLPPAKLLPRLVTLLLLLFAGLDLGMHRPGRLVRRVEPSLTRPWEHGAGGKVARMAGMMPSSSPTALPASYPGDVAAAGECVAGEYGSAAKAGGVVCAPTPPGDESRGAKRNPLESLLGRKNKSKGKVEERRVFAEDDEFGSSYRARPKGVDSEFEDDDPGAAPPGVVDAIFRVDLDALLRNANLPAPIEYAAKFAIKFHRAWVRCLWTLPTSLVRRLFALPRKALGGWVANPPWMLGVALLVRFATHVLVGNGKSPFSLDSGKGGSDGGGGSGGGIGGLGGNMDILGKVADYAKNYAASTFPRTALVLGTLMKVMKVDMYVLLCGMLIGLAITPIEEDHSTGIGGSVVEAAGRLVLGDGEL